MLPFLPIRLVSIFPNRHSLLLGSLLFFTSGLANAIQTQDPPDIIHNIETVDLGGVPSKNISPSLNGLQPEPTKIEFAKKNSGYYGFGDRDDQYRPNVTFHFDAQAVDVDLCFDAVGVKAGDVQLKLNGESIGASYAGENCITFSPENTLTGQNSLSFTHTRHGQRWGITNVTYDYLRESWLTLPTVTNQEWNNLAVRKVLQVFAFGGQATDRQIQTWANMSAKNAIKQMLNFAPHNFKLSPLPVREKYPQVASLDGTFWAFRKYMSNLGSKSPVKLGGNNYRRIGLGVDRPLSQSAWLRMTTARGLNPFRQKIGYWETNYHMAVNLDSDVTDRQLTYYYDTIMNAHAANKPYEEVIAAAAKSAAVAFQYGHHENLWIRKSVDGGFQNGNYFCQCNDDFAREMHQLFFGIFGVKDPQGLSHHEQMTIPETAKALTGMRVERDFANRRYPETVNFQTQFHHADAVDVLNTQINGVNAADKIDAIAAVAIAHPESLENLPVMIISSLADNHLTNYRKKQLRAAWAAMPRKNLLEFIRAYAVSNLFHAADRVKYFSSIDRLVYISNKLNLNNTEALTALYPIAFGQNSPNLSVFRPLHNVFGGQTGLEAAESAEVMKRNYNRFTELEYWQRRSLCKNCDNGRVWRKDWASIIPKVGGQYRADDVAAWLWRHFVGDGGKHYKVVERAHMLALIATSRDLNQLMCVRERRIAQGIRPSKGDILHHRTAIEILENDHPSPQRCDKNFSAQELTLLEKGFSSKELKAPEIMAIIDEMGDRLLPLNSADPNKRRNANLKIGEGINFILSTPYLMAQEAR